MKLIGLTGGIACGKSFVATMLKKAGIPVIDADDLSREVTALGTNGLSEVIRQFGPSYLNEDHSLNRKALGKLIFSSEQAREKLEKILHPLIQDAMVAHLQTLKHEGHTFAVYCAPLIFEKNIQNRFSDVILVDCSELTQIKRLMQRDSLSEPEARARISAQMPLDLKRQMTPYWVNNSHSKEECAESLAKTWQLITNQSVLFEP